MVAYMLGSFRLGLISRRTTPGRHPCRFVLLGLLLRAALASKRLRVSNPEVLARRGVHVRVLARRGLGGEDTVDDICDLGHHFAGRRTRGLAPFAALASQLT